jgi:hypothetical protein
MADLMEADEAIAQVRDDVSGYLGRAFTLEDDGPQFVLEDRFHGDGLSAIANENSAVVVWQFTGRHTGEFQYIEATGRDVVVQGCSVISPGGDGFELRHYINWVGVLGQLGVTFTRPLLPADA